LGRAIKNFKRAVTSANEIEVAPKKGEISDEKRPAAGSQPGEGQPKAPSA
jgi:hypothetical protein